jgi:hypothetical protein
MVLGPFLKQKEYGIMIILISLKELVILSSLLKNELILILVLVSHNTKNRLFILL